MSDAIREEIEGFITTVENKLQEIVQEFSDGKLNRVQFHVLYQRYSDQLVAANDALETGNINTIYNLRSGTATVAVRDAFEGKAVGLIIHHHASDSIVETLGKFGLSLVANIASKLSEIAKEVSANKFVDNEVQKIDEDNWLVLQPGRYTTLVVRFINEPSQNQSEAISRMRRDFEKANQTVLESGRKVEGSELAYPFAAFIRNIR